MACILWQIDNWDCHLKNNKKNGAFDLFSCVIFSACQFLRYFQKLHQLSCNSSNFLYIYIFKFDIRCRKTYLPEVSVSSIMASHYLCNSFFNCFSFFLQGCPFFFSVSYVVFILELLVFIPQLSIFSSPVLEVNFALMAKPHHWDTHIWDPLVFLLTHMFTLHMKPSLSLWQASHCSPSSTYFLYLPHLYLIVVILPHISTHCGRNTHFKQIYFNVPNFNFKYIYMKF